MTIKQCYTCEGHYSSHVVTDAIGWSYSIMCLECVEAWIKRGDMTKENILEEHNS